jgi:extracellular elastinolytic metalloproteinase
MQRSFRVLICIVASACLAAPAAAQRRAAVPEARVVRAPANSSLTLPSTASPQAVLAQYLRGRGRSESTVQSLVEVSRGAGRDAITHVRFEQRTGGMRVFGTYARAALNARGELVHVVENLATVGGAVERARVSPQQAIAAAIAHLYPALRSVPAGFFRGAPTATRVAIPLDDGSLGAGFVVQTWTQQANELHETLIDGSGAVLDVESRTSHDSYNVFRINPNVTPQSVVLGPGAGNAQSPSGWLFSGAQGSTDIAGNNVNAYLDVVSNNKSDGEGDAVADGNFVTAANLTAVPSTTDNREVAVQNLFFLNNLIHDELYRHGFNEVAGNFQEDNFGNGGQDSDSVNAEAQDGGGTDNANFATPRDGQNPRMQMYLWSGLGTHQVLAGGQTFLAQGADFGPDLTPTGITSTIQLVNDGTAPTSDGCQALGGGSLTGLIALLDRGNCDFTVKVKNAQVAGAVAVIVANNINADSVLVMGGRDRTITIPAVLISQNSGTTLKAMVPVSGTVRLTDPPPLPRDGDIDADIVFHEYCHGLTWRMIGRMQGALAGAIGEGMSDGCAILLNNDDPQGADAIGEYSATDPRGIRRFRYDGYPNTYGDVTGASVHNDGEIYAAIVWRMLELFGSARKDALFDYVVDGMNFTPTQPTYEEMRDGILASVASAPDDPGDECRVWNAFAEFGVGVGASGTARGQSAIINESFAVPAACEP